MSGSNNKQHRREIKKQFARENQRVFEGFVLEISAQAFWNRFVFCMRMAFKRHNIQKTMKNQITQRKRLLRAQDIMKGENKVLKFAVGVGIGIAIALVIGSIFVVGT